jgi:hypothetical protein
MKSIHIKWGLLLIIVSAFYSCEKYVEISSAPSQLSPTAAFSSDASATSAVLALYSYYYTTNSIGYITYCGSLAADDIQYTSTTASISEFGASSVTTSNSILVSYLWAYPYSVIREANQAIIGINNSTAVTATTKSQLVGEAKFFRALYLLNLVNYFGPVPLSIKDLETDNSFLPRADTATVYAQIIADLKDAESLLPTTYATTLRARANKYAASALLARTYLYSKDYKNAEAEATNVISARDVVYSLPVDSLAFVNTSPEVILQFSTQYGYSQFGGTYRTSVSTAVPVYVLNPVIISSFEAGDTRKRDWVDSVTSNNIKYYKIRKYKLVTATAGNEYDVVLRLAEQYLIRAEARAQQNNIAGAQADINVIRTRANLPNTTATTQVTLLAAVAQERKVELFGEMGHRWFDLKRTGQANAVISLLKPTTWKSTAVLMPIPVPQIQANSNLTQNPGY